jgi:hypothetical protein
MATALKYAEMSELREAVASRKQIRFVCSGLHYLAEPHAIENSLRTHSFVVVLWVVDGPGGPGWKTIRFYELREMEVLRDSFAPRPRPRW